MTRLNLDLKQFLLKNTTNRMWAHSHPLLRFPILLKQVPGDEAIEL